MLGTTLCGKRPCYIDIKSKPICDSISFNLNVFHSSKAKEIFKICAKERIGWQSSKGILSLCCLDDFNSYQRKISVLSLVSIGP